MWISHRGSGSTRLVSLVEIAIDPALDYLQAVLYVGGFVWIKREGHGRLADLQEQVL
jgi:hypothetical protein